jgi:hypothetical protein
VPDIHVPKLDEHGGGKSIFKLVLEVALISVGVFLGLAGEQWRERSHQRELAEQALHRFRTKLTANRAAVLATKDYHVDRLKELNVFFAAKPGERRGDGVHITRGIAPAFLEHSAWDLAIATQSLNYIDSELSVNLSSIYNLQQALAGLGLGFVQGMFVRPPAEDPTTYLAAAMTYFSDATLFDQQLMTKYDEVLPKIDKALGEKRAP